MWSILKVPSAHLLCLQEIANDGLYHPSVNMSIAVRVVVDYAPSDYPTDAQRSNGIVCGCTNYYNNPCRAEFRKVSILRSDHAACFSQNAEECPQQEHLRLMPSQPCT